VSALVRERFVHPALFYQGVDEYLSGTVPFVLAGLAGGAAVAVSVPGPNLALIRAALGPRANEVEMFDMSEVGRNPGRIIPGVLLAFADANRDRPVRIIGEPVWPGRSSVEYPACAQHEALINVAFTGREVCVLCPYDSDRLDRGVLDDAAQNHPILIDAAGEHASPTFSPAQVVDAFNLSLDLPDDRPVSRFLFSLDSLAQVRDYAVAQALRLGLVGRRVADLKIAVGELAANSILHGGGSGILAVWADGEHVVCEVRDAGTVTDPMAGRWPASPQQVSGRGLLLVNQLADLVRMHTADARTTIRAYFRL
jgi:anti-sigma regulatory factor (Ser/Thr protein kinase)